MIWHDVEWPDVWALVTDDDGPYDAITWDLGNGKFIDIWPGGGGDYEICTDTVILDNSFTDLTTAHTRCVEFILRGDV